MDKQGRYTPTYGIAKTPTEKLSPETITVNGKVITVEEYLKDPEKYNSSPIPKRLLKEVQDESN